MTQSRLFVFGCVLLATLVTSAEESTKQSINWKDIEGAQHAPSTPRVAVSVQAELDAYTISNLHHRAQTFSWQLTSSKIIFWMVVILVLAGVAFSAIQFAVALRRKADFGDGEIALNLEGIKVRSQFLGIITLALSLAFFYLYLKTVYPIDELAKEPQRTASRGS